MKVKFMPQNVEYEIPQGQSVMNLAHEKGIPIRSTCNGLPSCAECRVRVTDGDWNTNPPSKKELSLIGTGYYIDQRRLSCQLLCFGDITVDTTEQVEKASEGPVTKKFLNKVHKSSAAETHSVSGVLIEQDGQLLNELKADVGTGGGGEESAASLEEPKHRDRGGRHDGQNRQSQGGQRRDGRSDGQGGGQNRHAHGGRDGGPRDGGGHGGGAHGGGSGRRRRRGRGRGHGGGGGRSN